MKRNRSRLAALSAVLLVALLIVFSKDRIMTFVAQKRNAIAFPELKKEAITTLIIEKDAKKNVIKKTENGWYVEKDGQQIRADQERVEKAIGGLLNLKKEEPASTNKNKHKELGIDKQKISAKTKNKVYVIYVGGLTSGTKNYVRIDDENNIYIAAGFEETFVPDDYRDMKAGLIDSEANVSAVETQFDGKTIKLERKGSDWFIGNKRTKKDRVDFFLNDIKTIKGTDIIEGNITTNTSLKITIQEAGKIKTGAFYAKDDYIVLLKTSLSPYTLQLPLPYLNSLKKEEKDLLE